MNTAYDVILKDISLLRQSEEIDLVSAEYLADSIERNNIWITVIPVDRATGIVMDGNHRLYAGTLLALTHLPCILLDYNDPRVSVKNWGTGQPFEIDTIYKTVLSNKILPYKTTRHVFMPLLPKIEISLAKLRLGPGRVQKKLNLS
ncbi:MAG: hypothetical protein K0R08_329 [Solimicrobium sp.]|jgi:hypothetical protein|nr:hypothetical protein [Solimicrobium sp.]